MWSHQLNPHYWRVLCVCGGGGGFYKHCLAFIKRTKHTGKSLIGSKSLVGLLSVKTGTLRSAAGWHCSLSPKR